MDFLATRAGQEFVLRTVPALVKAIQENTKALKEQTEAIDRCAAALDNAGKVPGTPKEIPNIAP